MQQGVDLPLSRLPSELQSELTELMGELRIVDRQTLSEAADEFADELDAVGLSLSGGLEGALSLLESKIRKETGRKLRLEAGVCRFSTPWDRLRALSVEDLAPIVANEGIEVVAVLLSKLEVAELPEFLVRSPENMCVGSVMQLDYRLRHARGGGSHRSKHCHADG